jgi:hypothetical protein
MHDYQLVCPEHGTIALVASEKEPAKAMCWRCGAEATVTDSGTHDPSNY